MPLVLTTNAFVPNPDNAWNDVEGVQYHYPNQYKNKIRPGVEFVYYRGVLRKSGPRGQAEYFGRGRIGEIKPDPATIGQSRPSWFCAIEDYTPFLPTVPAKLEGVFYEDIPQNMWRNGVLTLRTSGRRPVARGHGVARRPVRGRAHQPAGLHRDDGLGVHQHGG